MTDTTVRVLECGWRRLDVEAYASDAGGLPDSAAASLPAFSRMRLVQALPCRITNLAQERFGAAFASAISEL